MIIDMYCLAVGAVVIHTGSKFEMDVAIIGLDFLSLLVEVCIG